MDVIILIILRTSDEAELLGRIKEFNDSLFSLKNGVTG